MFGEKESSREGSEVEAEREHTKRVRRVGLRLLDFRKPGSKDFYTIPSH